MSHMLHSKLAGPWKCKQDTNSILMEGAAMSFPLRLFLNCLSKAHCTWQHSGLFLDAASPLHGDMLAKACPSFAWHPRTSRGP